MLINGADGTVIGFVVGEGVRNKLENIFNPQRPQIHGYVRADADLHVGRDLIVVPDDALMEGEPSAHEASIRRRPRDRCRRLAPLEERALEESTRPSIWTRRTGTPSRARPQTPAEPRLKTETARAVENTPPSPAEDIARKTSPPDREEEAVITAPKDQSQV